MSLTQTAPAPSPTTATMTFPEFMDYLARGGQRGTKGYALDRGVDEEALARYVRGAVSVYERVELQEIIVNCEWASAYVVHLMKQRGHNRRAA